MRLLYRFIILSTFVLQSLIPAGFMPAFSNAGATIVICSGVTGESVEIQLNGEPSDHGEKESSKCAYSIAVSYTNVSTPNLVKLDASYILINARIEDALVAQSIISSNHTRGPPILSLA